MHGLLDLCTETLQALSVSCEWELQIWEILHRSTALMQQLLYRAS